MNSVLRVLLWPFSRLFGLGVWVRNFLYDKNLLKIHRVQPVVISVGNLSVGGTGKTPWVMELARRVLEKNLKVGIVARGYGGNHSGVLAVTEATPAIQSGDEPLLFAKEKLGPVYVSTSKTKAAKQLTKDHIVQYLIVDDGFQHRRLHRDFNVVIVDTSSKIEDHSLLPSGRFREPFSSLSRADLVILNKWNLSNSKRQSYWRNLVLKNVPENRVIVSSYAVGDPVPLRDRRKVFNPSQPYMCMAAIGSPSSFIKSCELKWGRPAATFFIKDHALWTEERVGQAIGIARSGGITQLVTTEKDGVKLGQWEGADEVAIWQVPLEISIESGEELLMDHLFNIEF